LHAPSGTSNLAVNPVHHLGKPDGAARASYYFGHCKRRAHFQCKYH
jgi:hypothetical protein